MNETIKKFLTDNLLGVIATQNGTHIESAAVYYGFDDGFSIYLNTHTASRKFKNIEQNPNVSFVVYQQNPAMTLQLEGTIESITEVSKITEIYDTLLRRTLAQGTIPPIHQIQSGETALLKITPTWARFADFSQGTTIKPGTFTMLVGEEK